VGRKANPGVGGVLLALLALAVTVVQQHWRALLAGGAVVVGFWLVAKYVTARRNKAERGRDFADGIASGGSTAEKSIGAPSPNVRRGSGTVPAIAADDRPGQTAPRKGIFPIAPAESISPAYRPASRLADTGSRGFVRRDVPASTDPDSVWVPFGTTTQVGGFRLPGGLLYVGAGLGAVTQANNVEPALIDPRLAVSSGGDCRTRLLNYWPSYSEASPEARGAYLKWLAGGRVDPAADLGYVFLFFYGLERRALADAQVSQAAAADIPAIEREVARLLEIYGGNGSFNHYATSFLDFLGASGGTGPLAVEPPPAQHGSGLSFAHRLALARFAAAGQPLPAPWALAWLRADPTTRLRTPALRCPDEFQHLFAEHYRDKYGEGMKLPVNKTRLAVSHRPASGSFLGRTFEKTFDLPDLSVLSSPVKKLQQVADACIAQLDGYSRILGRSPDKKGSLDAFLELPIRLWPEQNRQQLAKTRDLITKAGLSAAIKFEKLLSWLPDWRDITKARVSAFAARLAEAGLGMEPDPRFGGPIPEGPASTVVLFADDGTLSAPSARYSAAALTLHLAAVVSAADGEVADAERTLLLSQMGNWLHLDEAERRRLHAHARWLLAEPPSLTGIKKRVEALPATAREAIGEFLTQVAQADSEVTPGEVKMLERIFKTLALDTKSLYSKLHVAATEPVTVRPGTAVPTYAIPQPPKSDKTSRIGIDMAKVAALQAESERVTAILASIFAADVHGAEPSPAPEPADISPEPVVTGVMGLAVDLSDFARLLATRSQWARAELEELAIDRGLMLDGALAHINEAAFDTYDQPFSEGDEPVELNPDVVKEILK
jgi:uncharacterized tellurite resistance protein B-like protein